MSTPARNDNAESGIRTLMDGWLTAFLARDVPGIMRYYTPDVRAFDAVARLQFEGRDDYARHWAECMESCQGQLIVSIEDMRVESSGDLGLCHYLVRCGMVDADGNEKASWMRGTLGLRRVDGHWRVAHEHVSVPFDMTTGAALFDLQP